MSNDDPIATYQRVRSAVNNAVDSWRSGPTSWSIGEVNEFSDVVAAYQRIRSVPVTRVDVGVDTIKVAAADGSVIEFSPYDVTDETVKRLVACATPAPFGRGTETVVDETVRKAVEIPGDRLTIESSSYTTPTDSKTISSALRTSLHYKVVPYKMHIYPEGGHFDQHLDTLHGKDHVATAVLGLGTEYEGGELVVRDEAMDLRPTKYANHSRLNMAVFYTDQPHTVQPVTSGTRIVIQFDIHLLNPGSDEYDAEQDKYDEDEDGEPWEAECASSDEEDYSPDLLSELVDALCAVGVEKFPLALMCAHLYSVRSLSNIDLLRGSDRDVYDALSPHFNIRLEALTVAVEKNGYNEPNETYIKPLRWSDDDDDDDEPNAKRRCTSDSGGSDEASGSDKASGSDEVDDADEVSSTPPRLPTVIPWNARAAKVQLDSSPYIEHTGNESQAGVDVYHAVCMVLERK